MSDASDNRIIPYREDSDYLRQTLLEIRDALQGVQATEALGPTGNPYVDGILALRHEIAQLKIESGQVIARLTAELHHEEELRNKLTDILTRTAAALKGPPHELQMHNWADLPEVAAAVPKSLGERLFNALNDGKVEMDYSLDFCDWLGRQKPYL